MLVLATAIVKNPSGDILVSSLPDGTIELPTVLTDTGEEPSEGAYRAVIETGATSAGLELSGAYVDQHQLTTTFVFRGHSTGVRGRWLPFDDVHAALMDRQRLMLEDSVLPEPVSRLV